jgi:Ras-related protein Rab-18
MGLATERPQANVLVMRQKILLMGESGVGKSSILRKYRHTYVKNKVSLAHEAKSCEFTHAYMPTVGVDFVAGNKPLWRTINGRRIRTVSSFLDFSGSAAFLKIRAEFYNDFAGGVLVFDVSNKESFLKLDIWLKEIRSFRKPSDDNARTDLPWCVVCMCAYM